jgi:hypothetical protein
MWQKCPFTQSRNAQINIEGRYVLYFRCFYTDQGSNGILAAGLSHFSSIRELFNTMMANHPQPPIHEAAPEHPLSKAAESKQTCNARKKTPLIGHEF